MKKILFIALAATTLVACHKGGKEIASKEMAVEIATATRAEVSEATGEGKFTIAVPNASDFAVTIEGNGQTFTWPTLAEYITEYEKGYTFATGPYTVTLTHGEEGVEGYNKPYFSGSSSVEAPGYRLTANVNVECVLANSIIAIETTDNFNGYFPESEFTVNGIEWNGESEELLFMNAGEVTIVCEAVRQSDMASGAVTTLRSTVTLKPTTRHTVKFDLSTAGNATVNITFDNEVIKQEPVDTELNDRA